MVWQATPAPLRVEEALRRLSKYILRVGEVWARHTVEIRGMCASNWRRRLFAANAWTTGRAVSPWRSQQRMYVLMAKHAKGTGEVDQLWCYELPMDGHSYFQGKM